MIELSIEENENPKAYCIIKVDDQHMPIFLKDNAWINMDNNQIKLLIK